MTVQLETLEFQIQSAGDVAAQGVDALTQSLRRLRGASTGLSGVNRLNNQLKSLNQTLTSFRAGTLETLARALNGLATIRDIRIPNSLYRQISAIGGAMTILTDENIDRLERLGQVLQTFRGLEDVHIPNMRTLGGSNQNNGRPLESGIETATQAMEDASRQLPNLVTIISEAFRDLSAAITVVSAAISRIVAVFRIVIGIIRAAINIVKQFLAAINRLLAPVKKFAGLMASAFVAPFKKIGETIKGAFSGIKQLWESLKRIAMYRLVRTAIATLTQAVKAGIDNLYQWSKLVDGEFSKSMDKIATSALYVKNSLAAMVSPLINSLAPVIDMISDKLVGLLNRINQTFASLLGRDTYIAAKKIEAEFAKIKSHMIGIDELNIIEDEQPPVNEMFEEIPIDEDIENFVEKLRKIFEDSDWESLGTMLGDKINSWIDAVDWEAVGERIGYWLNAAAQIAYYTLDTIDFTVAGEKIGEMATNILESVDWEIVGRLLVKKITAVWDLAIGFLKELDWGEVARDLSDFIVGALKEIGDWFTKYNWSDLGEILLKKITDFFKNFDFETAISSFFTGLGKAVRAIKDLLTPLWDAFKDWWAKHIKGESFKETMKNLVDYIKTFVNDNVLTPFINGFLGEDEGGEEGEKKSGMQRLKEVGWNIIAGIIQGAEDWVKDNLWKWIADFFFGSWWDALCDVFIIHSPAEAMKPIGENILLGILEGIKNKFDSLNEIVNNIKEILGTVAEKTWEIVVAVIDAATEIITAIGTAVANLVTAGANLVITAIDAATSVITTIGMALEGIIATGANLIITAIDAATGVITTIGMALEGIIAAGASLVITAIDAASEVISTIGQALSGIIAAGANLVITAIDAASEVIQAIGNALARIITAGANLVITAIDAASTVIEAIGNALAGLISAGANLVITAIDAASTVIEAIGNALARLIGAAATFVVTAIDAASKVIEAIGNSLARLINATATFVVTAVDAASKVIESIGNSLSRLVTSTSTFVITAIDSASSVIQTIANSLNSLISTATSVATQMVTAFSGAFSSIVTAAGTFAASVLTALSMQAVITQITRLTDKLGELEKTLNKIPSLVNIKFETNVNDTISEVNSIISDLLSIPTNITVTINIVTIGEVPQFNFAGGIAHAKGGIIPHATGSIITRPTITQYKGQTHLFGEAGREAILPLDSYTGWMDEVAERVTDSMPDDEERYSNLIQALDQFYERRWEPIINKIATNTQRTAEKDDRPVVKIGNRDIRNAYDTQVKADGFSFTK